MDSHNEPVQAADTLLDSIHELIKLKEQLAGRTNGQTHQESAQATSITRQGDRHEVILAPGETFTLNRDGAPLSEQRPVPSDTRWWWRAGQALLGHFMRLGMNRAAWRRAYRI